jgi:hypothetical protein
VLLAVLFCILLNVYAFRHDIVWDFTEENIHQLSEQTESILERLQDTVLVSVWHSEKSSSGYKEEKLLRKYKERAGDKFSYEFLDPVHEPELFARANLQEGDRAILRAERDGHVRELRLPSVREESLSGALLSLSAGAPKKLYIVQGHREPDIDSLEPFGLGLLVQDLKRENVEVHKLLLAEHKRVPRDAHAVFLISPRTPLLPEEERELSRFVKEGGSLFVSLDPGSVDLNFLNDFGVEAGNDLIVDAGEKGYGAQLLVTRIGRHASTEKLLRGGKGESALVMTMASSIKINPEVLKAKGLQSQVLLKTSSQAWGESDFQAALARKPIRKDEQEAQGELPLGVVLEGIGEEKKGKLLLLGDSDWLLNGNRHWYANRDFALDATHWSFGGLESLGIRPRALRASREQLSDSQLFLLGVLTFLICELLVLSGLLLSYRRSHGKIVIAHSSALPT